MKNLLLLINQIALEIVRSPNLHLDYDNKLSVLMRKSCLKFELVFFLRQIAIKEIILDPNKKNRTKEAVLKEARYIHLCKLFYQLIITIIINLLLLL